MKCPVCKTPDLLMAERRSIEIDYCPACRGVWLDRGELDKLIAQEEAEVGRGVPAARADFGERQEKDRRYDDDRSYGERGHTDHRRGHSGYRKKRSLFDMFDFD